MTLRRATDFFLFAMVFSVTFEKLYWNVSGKVNVADVFALLFVLGYSLQRLGRGGSRFSRTTGIVLIFFAAFLLVYLIGFYNLETRQSLDQFGKGFGKFVLHFAFLASAVDYLAHRAERLYWRTLAWFCAGVAIDAGYGALQQLAAQAGHNLDSFVVQPLTGHQTEINVYGAVNGSNVYRADGLTGDPNHLGIYLIVPLLVLTPLYLRLKRGHRSRLPLALLLGLLLLVELATLSRSGILGLLVGFAILLLPYRRLLFSRAILVPLALVSAAVVYEVQHRKHFFDTVLQSRLQRGGTSTSVHFGVYGFIPHVLHSHPLFGLGFNNFSVYYQFVTGKTNWGPHSFYVALMVETGLVGTALFAVFLWYVFRRLQAAQRLGRALAAASDPLAAQIRPLAWGLTAALAGTMAANIFYLTMTFFYFHVFVLLALGLTVVFSRRLVPT